MRSPLFVRIVILLGVLGLAVGCDQTDASDKNGAIDGASGMDRGRSPDTSTAVDSIEEGSWDALLPRDMGLDSNAAPAQDEGLAKDAIPTPDIAPVADAAFCDKIQEGNYTSLLFSITATEKVGSSIINQMICEGSLSVVVECSNQPPVQGTYSCTTTSGLVIFDKTQTGTLEGQLGQAGAFSGTITHSYSSSLKKNYKYSATINKAGQISGSGNGSLLPNPMAVQPWEVEIVF